MEPATFAWIGAGLLALVLLARAGTSSTSSSGAPSPPRPAVTSVMVAGDSLAVGVGPRVCALYEPRGIPCRTHAATGTSARDWRHSIGQFLASDHPDTVLLSVGTNDAASSTLLAEFSENFAAINDACRAAGARCVLLAPPNGTRLEVPPGSWVLVTPPGIVALQPDGLHPTVPGYDAWAGYIVSHV